MATAGFPECRIGFAGAARGNGFYRDAQPTRDPGHADDHDGDAGHYDSHRNLHGSQCHGLGFHGSVHFESHRTESRRCGVHWSVHPLNRPKRPCAAIDLGSSASASAERLRGGAPSWLYGPIFERAVPSERTAVVNMLTAAAARSDEVSSEPPG